ncbi:MAG: AAA family ATPase [Verrucomicrobia bacterium]|nr:AAA family ATPase [Verrucomicrobiota bacterium]
MSFATLTLRFGDEALVRELPGLDLRWCAETPGRLDDGARQLARRALEAAPPRELSRLLAAPVERQVSTVLLTLDPPPGRPPGWISPVELCLHLVQGRVGELWTVRVPALDLEVFAEDETQLRERVESEVRSALQRRQAHKSLTQLVGLPEIRSVEPDQLLVTADLRDPFEDDDSSPEKKSALEQASDDLTLAPRRAWGVGEAVAQLASFLGGQPPQHVLLIGPPGVGKTALQHELIRRRAELGFPRTPFRATSGTRLVAGMSGFGEWQERVGEFAREAARRKAVVHFGHLPELLQSGRHSHNQQGIGSFLRPFLARGEFLAVAECTPEQLPALEREDPHLLELFVPLRVEEPDAVRGREILAAAAPEFPAEALARLDALHRRYATTSAYPGRPLRFLRHLQRDRRGETPATPGEVIAAFARETGLPPVMLDDALTLDLTATSAWFRQRVIGQPAAVEQVVDLLAVVKQRLARPRKPLASFLFAGPTGVGKTELARSLAAFLFGDAERVTRFDMSEFATPAAVYRLLGGPESEGQLTARVREQPFSVLLFDEFEKAHPLFFDLLLPVLGEGRLTDVAGRLADFTNAVVILTSNLGATSYQAGQLGFAAGPGAQRDAREHFTAAVRQALRPELFNRFDRIVPFSPLDEATVQAIAERELGLVRQREGLRFRALELGPGVAAHFARVGFDVRYGARPLKRAVERGLLVPLADAINGYAASLRVAASVRLVDGELRIEVQPEEQQGPTPAESRLGLWARDLAAARRDLQLLAGCGAVRSLANLATQLEHAHRRLLRRAPEAIPPTRLRQLRDLLQRIEAQLRDTEAAETDLLVALYDRTGELAPEEGVRCAALIDRARQLIREVYDTQYEASGRIALALFSEERDWLRQLAIGLGEAAEQLGATVRLHAWEIGAPGVGERAPAVEAVPRASRIPVLRREVAEPKRYLNALPDQVLGLMLRLEGPSACTLWEGEAGLHTEHLPSKKRRHALVETSRAPLDYLPPEGIERRGGIGPGETLRHYHRSANHVTDPVAGTLPWRDGLGAVLAECATLRLQENLRAMLEDRR